MPPQQFQRLLDVFGNGLNFRTHPRRLPFLELNSID